MSRLEKILEIGNHQPELLLRSKRINLSNEHEYSKRIASQAEMKPEDIKKMKYFRLKVLPEQYSYEEYYYPENKPYHVYLHKIADQWFVYKSYQRISDISAIDNFNTKIFYMRVIPDDIMDRGDFYEINDFISTVSILHGDYNRKLELQHVTGGGFRPNLRSMKGRKVLPTFLASYAREQKSGPLMVKVLIDRHIADIRDYQREKLQNIEKNLEKNNIVAQIKAFISNHKDWVQARKKMNNYAALQHKIRKTVPFKRSSATRLVVLKNVTVSDLCNELIDYPTWVGFHFYLMRVLNKNGLNIVYDDINYAVREGKRLRHLRIRPSKYVYKPQATTVFRETKVYSKGQISLDHWPLNDYPPSVESVSGYSTVTQMSTATTSPNSWQNDWTMQPRHDEYDHRLTEATIPDVRDTRARGDEQFAVRFNNEINKRIDFALADIETVLSTTMLNYKMDPCVIAACDTEALPTILDRPGDMTWLKNVESYINSILINDNPSVEEKKDLKVLYYAKQRYEQTLSIYDKHLLSADNPELDNEKTSDMLQSDHGDNVGIHLYINDSWRKIVDSNRFPPNVLKILNLLITDRDAWPLDSDFSNLSLVDRADRISIPTVIDLFNFYHLNDKQIKILAIGTLIFIILMFILLAGVLFVSQNKEDLGYCPSNVMGFDPENPYQVEWMQSLLNIKTPSKNDNSTISTAHFFMLDN